MNNAAINRRKKITNIIIKYIGITIGSIIYAVSTSLFLDPNNLAPGGMIGLAVILSRIIPLTTGILFFILNIPVMIYGLKKFGWKFMVSTLYAVLMSSVFTNVFGFIEPLTNDLFIAALAGAIIQGVGIGIVFRFGATTGGTDVIVKSIRQRYRHIKTGTIFFLTDLIIVIASGFVFKDLNIVFYALLTVVISGVAMDFVLYGSDEARLMFIISDYSDDISRRIMKELDIGLTFVNGVGAYTNSEKKVIMCAAKKNIAPQVEDIVKEVDKEAFLIISSANEIYGEGHKNILGDRF